jgi:predicted unusual protein kinase regulating ubiquinone biosynthesis (AarF/ABC1/UbiB family)
MPFERVDATIREAYGRGVDQVFERFDREPVAAASLAQVHEARYKGETVAVKVLRPGVERQVEADVAAARRILRWLDRWWGHPHIKRELTALAAFEQRVREEVNFEQEAAYAAAIRQNFAGNSRVVIPRVHDEMTRRRVLVMEFVEGTRVDRLDPAHVDVKHVVQTLVELYIQMELIDGLVHADPHPGCWRRTDASCWWTSARWSACPSRCAGPSCTPPSRPSSATRKPLPGASPTSAWCPPAPTLHSSGGFPTC